MLSHVPYSAALRTGKPRSECLVTILEPSLTTYMKNLALEYHAQHSLSREQMFMLMVTAVTTITNMNFLKKFSVDAVTIRA